jgi:hypothetical protein
VALHLRHSEEGRDLSFQLLIGNKVMLSGKNINFRTKGTRKVLPKRIGLFTTKQASRAIAIGSQIENSSSIHDSWCFHVSLLKPYKSDGSYQPPPPQIVDGELYHEIDRILDHQDVQVLAKTKAKPSESI